MKIQSQNSNYKERLARLDSLESLKKKILPFCRLKKGEIWIDPGKGHKVGVLDAANDKEIASLFDGKKAIAMIHDPPYNIKVGSKNTESLYKISLSDYLENARLWIKNSLDNMLENSHLYVWIGADYKDNFQPLPDFMIMMREFTELTPRNIITMRNQRGFGTQKNWMWIRQELLYYVKGAPGFNVEAEYTDIPRILKGYYKEVGGEITENSQRSKSKYIRAGNVWVDIQQVFYRMEENVPGCYAQKPLKALERIILASSKENEIIGDFFSHSGSTLLAAEKLNRIAYVCDIDPIFAEITIRRLERYRSTGKLGWQWNSPFPEIEENN